MATTTEVRPGRASGPIGAVSDSDGAEAPKNGKKRKAGKGEKKSKKKLIIVIVVVLIVGVVGYKMFGPKAPPPKTPPPPKPGAVVAMTDTTLNLTDGHFLKVKLGLQTVAGAPADLDTSKAADLLISEFTGQTMATLSTAERGNHLQDDLLCKN